MKPPEVWVVTHQRSGLVVAVTVDPETAMMLAVKLASVTDWTQSGETIIASGVRASTIRDVIGDATASGPGPRELVDRNAVAR